MSYIPRQRSFRKFLALALAGLASMIALVPCQAAERYPSRPIRLIVAFAPGGLNDLTARELASRLQAKLGQPVVVENKPSAGQIVAMQTVAGAPADGYTLLFGSVTGFVLTPHLFKKLPVDPSTFVPIAPIGVTPTVLLAAPNFPANNFTELAKLAKSRSNGFTYASTGVGASAHVVMAIYAKAAGLDAKHIPYRGDVTALMAVRSGEVDVGAVSLFAALPHIKSGDVKAIGVFQENKARSLPALQTVGQVGVKDAAIPAWVALFAAPKTPVEIVRKLEAATREVVASPAFQEVLTSRGSEPFDMDNKRFADYVSRQSAQAGKAISSLNIQPNE